MNTEPFSPSACLPARGAQADTAQAGCPLPWHGAQWDALHARRRAAALPHALLLSGPQGLGKERFARVFAQALLCAAPRADGPGCQGCPACVMFNAGTHPDYQRIAPVEEGKAVGIDQVRQLIAWIGLKSHAAGYKIALITQASRMTVEAANALLKTLEEPPSHSLLMLITDRPALLPATVRSRCQKIHFIPPVTAAAYDTALEWLKKQLSAEDAQSAETLLALAGGAPLRALEYAKQGMLKQRARLFSDMLRLTRGEADPVALAAAWLVPAQAGMDLKQLIHLLSSWIADMLRLEASAQAPLNNPDLRVGLAVLAGACPGRRLYDYLDRLSETTRLLDKPLNAQLLLEDLLLAWPITTHGRSALAYT
jgi:DNA polymerase-3 subunit delta'